MAFDMFTERMRPDAPSKAPAMIRSLLSSTKPMAAAESPAYEFKREITVGISAPPMGMIIITPNRSGMPTISGKSCVFSGCATSMPATTIATPNNPRLTMFCPLYVMGRCGRTSCNFPAAIKLPVNVSEPRMTSSESTPIMNRGTSGVRK